MTTNSSDSSKSAPFRNVPPPVGSRSGNAYTRFIPREELQGFASWQPGSFGAGIEGADPAPRTEKEWQLQLAAARQAGAQEGYQNGYRDGLAALESFKQSFALQATTQLGQLVRSFDAELLALEAQIAQALARAAVDMARQVLRSELSANPGVIASVAAQAVSALMQKARQITLQVHPLDLALVEQGAAEVLNARGARLVANPAVERGGCIALSDLGSIDARIGMRWAQATASLGAGSPWSGAPEQAAE